ncbi:DUF5825 family protein [Micromonospora carbonacea]|uniref:Uncharacterized protein n=1 Tax=Micromonospora carbonacea TaxID=47853 RepID=A0A7H8XL64_9ACTN|nr:DUF5825 family protein [Micromonospora carbonacea]MBB5827257.1 hypothetical protein [Micromonospora carbonacea]QLD24959.1 hypothetical protein HXZ27_12675 [Micromonospora carbonacea]
MPSPRGDFGATVVEVELSRDYDPAAARLPGMALGTRRLVGPCGETVAGWYAAGARHARLAHPVDLCADADARAARSLLLVRELTARGIAVDWTARCRDGCHGGDLFTHLCPPSRLDGDATGTVAARWRAAFFLGRCVYRRGPGFVEVRDRRSGALEVVTIDEPGHLAAIAPLAEGVAATAVPADVRRDLVGAHLVAEQAGHLWWLPTRAHRWPFPALIV